VATFLSLCQTTHRLLRAGNNLAGSQPTTVVGQTDQLLSDIVYFVNEAWQQVQSSQEAWLWMRKSATITLPINTSTTYNQQVSLATLRGVASDWRNAQVKNAAQYNYALIFDPNQTPAPPTEMPSYYIPWLEFDGWWNRLPRTQGVPLRWTEDPQYNLWFDQPPLAAPSGAAYQCKIIYRTINQQLTVDADTPNMMADFHDLIPYWAAWLYCQTRGSKEESTLSDSCANNMARILTNLKAKQLPVWVLDDRYA
jgi:hypothetical protein